MHIPRFDIDKFCADSFDPGAMDKGAARNLVHFFRDLPKLDEPLDPEIVNKLKGIRAVLDQRLELLCSYIAPEGSTGGRARAMTTITKAAVNSLFSEGDDEEMIFERPPEPEVTGEQAIELTLSDDSESVFDFDVSEDELATTDNLSVHAQEAALLSIHERTVGEFDTVSEDDNRQAALAIAYLENPPETISAEVREILEGENLENVISNIVFLSGVNLFDRAKHEAVKAKYLDLAKRILRS